MAAPTERSAIRAAGRRARQELPADERDRAESALIGHLRSLALVRARSVGVFVAHDGEPDLTPLVHWLWKHDIIVALPVLRPDPGDFSMCFVPWFSGDELHPGRYGIPVPPDAPPIDPAVVLVSFTAFDPLGNRLGRGGGFFDRYLAVSDTSVIGVGFEVQRTEQIPAEPHDVPLPVVVTDLGVRFVEKNRRNVTCIGKDGVSCA